ncbi:MAG: DUF6596 domain-containing protein [Bryobacteraceae bacterium]
MYVTTGDAEHLLRELAPQVLGALVRRSRDFSASEDALQEALLAAAVQWPREGLPDNPRAWLIQVGLRRWTDHARSEIARRQREASVAEVSGVLTPSIDSIPGEEHDDTLTLLFMCCHPALSRPSAIALTLRAVGGLTTAEIASAFLVPEATMAQRISRAKQTVRGSGIPFCLPDAHEREGRLAVVLHVLYLIFNEGYTSSSGVELVRADLSSEAIRLTRLLNRLLPGHGDVEGLLALMLLTDARRGARTGRGGELIPLAEQDRAHWDQPAIREGITLVTAALAKEPIGPYQVQAAIAAVHDEATRAEETDWPQILALYEVLKSMSDNPMVLLNHAVAAAMVHGPARGLDLLRELDAGGKLAGHHRRDAVWAHLLEMSGDHQGAIAHFRAAAGRTSSLPERNYLLTHAARLAEHLNKRPG